MAKSGPSLRALIALSLLPLLTAAGEETCLLCRTDGGVAQVQEQREIPISIDITTKLDFSRAALTGKGSGAIIVDPQATGRQVNGELIDLGGFPLAGQAIIRGEPGRAVRVDMPVNTRLTSATGGVVEIVGLKTDLPVAPRLDGSGRLEFSFGGRLLVKGDAAGTFRGRIPITALYE